MPKTLGPKRNAPRPRTPALPEARSVLPGPQVSQDVGDDVGGLDRDPVSAVLHDQRLATRPLGERGGEAGGDVGIVGATDREHRTLALDGLDGRGPLLAEADR